MKYSLRSSLLAAFLLGASILPVHAANPAWLARLRSPDVAVRRAAVDEIQTIDDPRIPEACLPLLNDDGESIRRQAARAIGSRFDQIPRQRNATFLAALKQCAARGPEDVTLVARRAIGLLSRDYSSAAFSVSPGGKWILYERRRLPVIADVKRQAHMLAIPILQHGEFAPEATYVHDGDIEDVDPRRDIRNRRLKLMVTNEPVSDLFSPAWRPDGGALAFRPVIQERFFRPICIWRASDGQVKVCSVEFFKSLLRGHFPHWGTTTDFVKWDAARAIIHVYDCDTPGGGEPFDPKGVMVSVDTRTWKTALVK